MLKDNSDTQAAFLEREEMEEKTLMWKREKGKNNSKKAKERKGSNVHHEKRTEIC